MQPIIDLRDGTPEVTQKEIIGELAPIDEKEVSSDSQKSNDNIHSMTFNSYKMTSGKEYRNKIGFSPELLLNSSDTQKPTLD